MLDGDDSLQYIISDIHGDLKSFRELLKYIDFEKDELTILGDVLDKGKKPMESLMLICDLMDNYLGHVLLVKGNHELFASMYLDGKLSERTWLTPGYRGDETLNSLKKMNKAEIKEFKCFIDSLPLYCEIESSTELKRLVLRGRNSSFDSLSSQYDFKDYSFSGFVFSNRFGELNHPSCVNRAIERIRTAYNCLSNRNKTERDGKCG